MATAGPDSGSGYFGELLLRHRTAAGLSQRALARRSGLSERAVRDLERGATSRPRRASVQAVAGALGLTGHNLAAFVAAADGPAEDTPSAAALSTRPLPDPGGFVGRDAELRVLSDLVAGGRYRLITVTRRSGNDLLREHPVATAGERVLDQQPTGRAAGTAGPMVRSPTRAAWIPDGWGLTLTLGQGSSMAAG